MGAAVAAPSRPNLDRPWHGAPDRGRGMHFPSQRQPYSPEGHFDRHAIGGHFDSPYHYDENGHGMKRPFYMTVSFFFSFLFRLRCFQCKFIVFIIFSDSSVIMPFGIRTMILITWSLEGFAHV